MKTLQFPLFGGRVWFATFKDDRAVSFDLSQVTPAILAHGLSLVNRFCGSTPRGYSVAEHSLWLTQWVRQIRGADLIDSLACLIHDAPEAMGVADSHGALKKLIAEPTRRFEADLSQALWTHLVNIDVPFSSVWWHLHPFDQDLGDWEAHHFGFPSAWSESGLAFDPPVPIMMAASAAESAWLAYWEYLWPASH